MLGVEAGNLQVASATVPDGVEEADAVRCGPMLRVVFLLLLVSVAVPAATAVTVAVAPVFLSA